EQNYIQNDCCEFDYYTFFKQQQNLQQIKNENQYNYTNNQQQNDNQCLNNYNQNTEHFLQQQNYDQYTDYQYNIQNNNISCIQNDVIFQKNQLHHQIQTQNNKIIKILNYKNKTVAKLTQIYHIIIKKMQQKIQ
ncbi:hypothetical protein IMG5_065110, partial [Ichthyophthirius multifiliis]